MKEFVVSILVQSCQVLPFVELAKGENSVDELLIVQEIKALFYLPEHPFVLDSCEQLFVKVLRGYFALSCQLLNHRGRYLRAVLERRLRLIENPKSFMGVLQVELNVIEILLQSQVRKCNLAIGKAFCPIEIFTMVFSHNLLFVLLNILCCLSSFIEVSRNLSLPEYFQLPA